ncbi:zinc-dependent metalloprotease [Chryseobacterium mulctrae]|uniref:zinc-dependent metalloprotease n=1 Tax=Chryseobacterium mulctrae TaxID=2576777 RepID=UPI001E57547B|nr:zinc-dependent metalloprotease [Chryseobacterium mulctrae]
MSLGYKYFGTTGAAEYPYNGGRTATHEIGHYFGLLHPWGEDDSLCGTPDNDDGCADTPAIDYPHGGGNVFPDNSNMCTPTANGAMFMNFMDYVTDTEMALFTNDQKTIKSNTMSGPRASLLNSNACSFLSVNEVEKANSINLFPNPTTQYISIASPLAKINEIEIFNAEGRLVKKAFIKNETDKIDVKDFAAGVYYVRTYNDKNFIKSMKFIKK